MGIVKSEIYPLYAYYLLSIFSINVPYKSYTKGDFSHIFDLETPMLDCLSKPNVTN